MGKTAIYARTQDNITEKDGMNRQIAACMEHADSADVEIYKDYGSGADMIRPEFVRMMQGVRSGAVTRVITANISRLSRNFIQAIELIREIESCGCTILLIAEGIDTAKDHPTGKETPYLKGIIGAWEKRGAVRRQERCAI